MPTGVPGVTRGIGGFGIDWYIAIIKRIYNKIGLVLQGDVYSYRKR